MACVKRMEIPADVAGIINEYAKPRMKFSGEYNRCVRELAQAHQTDNWTTLKQRLCDKDADQVIQAYVAHTEAKLATYTTRQAMMLFQAEMWRINNPTNEYVNTYMTRARELASCVGREFRTKCALMDVLYGKEEIDSFHM